MAIAKAEPFITAGMGIVFFVLVFAGTGFEPRFNAERASDEEFEAFYRDNRAAIRTFGVLTAAGYAALAWFLVALARAAGPETELARASGLLGLATVVLSLVGVMGAAAGGFTGVADASVLRPFAAMGASLYDLSVELGTFPRGLFLIAVGWATWRSRGLPRWLSVAASALGGASVLAGFGLVTDWTETYVRPLGFGAYILFFFWAPAASLALLLRARRGVPAAALPAPSEAA